MDYSEETAGELGDLQRRGEYPQDIRPGRNPHLYHFQDRQRLGHA